ncbi:MAG: hypothetical protein M1829_005663 [Trizodia sp. TS-e1964]|nr:MAG: hypothetical protein M1829_005663 [Trizodia sp. TS-e1964]
MSVWNPDNVRDVAESVGISALSDDVILNLSRDIDYRIAQVLEEALKFMRHGKRNLLGTQDVAQALRALDVEPLYGYETTRPLKFGEASLGPGQPLFYVEDEELDFEKLINAPLPKVPREISFTAHWLAVEGVQPSIPQNPTTADLRSQDLIPKGPGANPYLAALNGSETVTVKPLVKHIISKELQQYFERICDAVLDEESDEYRAAAFGSLRTDPGLHGLVPYFVQFIAEKVTHNLKNIFLLTQMMHLASALLDNESIYVHPYIASIIPSVLTCLIGRKLGNNNSAPTAHFTLRELAASLIGVICRKYSKASHTLKPRLARTCLKHFLDPNKPSGVHYGCILGLQAIGGSETIRVLVLPNLKAYDGVLKDNMLEDVSRRIEAEFVLGAIVKSLMTLEEDYHANMTNGSSGDGGLELRNKLMDTLGEVIGAKIFELGRPRLSYALLH